MEMSYIRVLET